MAGSVFNTAYFRENRAIAKIIEIVIGFILCSLLCGVWYAFMGYKKSFKLSTVNTN